MDRNLFLAILAMDSYNRGYGVGIKDLDVNLNVTKIGNATIRTDSVTEIGASAESTGFYALAYDMTGVEGFSAGDTVIAYRGTDANFAASDRNGGLQ
ncbi:hypothetical protein [Rhizorhapis suberifaciens]|uniref:Uncharacterized protein n=1 Tax=Rhizorhapis suberifaciens TaxID=13656 RepID=A0A840HSI5_9SPHN|nr:hypothetical protein [Rhizorhapis suberifaciens]MBB4640569.1 hypothetical protein [Rhizorhapis suberifaciens]